jgi:nucleotide-binding universal stress UspA family protein
MITFRRILCPTDFSEASLKAIPYAVELGRLFDAEIFVIHVAAVVPPMAAELGFETEAIEFNFVLHKEAERKLDQLIKPYADSVKIRKILLQGSPAEEILQAIGDNKIDLVTIATHGHTGWRHLVFGSVAEKVVRLANVPVLTVNTRNLPAAQLAIPA